jgi:hypothetical protein
VGPVDFALLGLTTLIIAWTLREVLRERRVGAP